MLLLATWDEDRDRIPSALAPKTKMSYLLQPPSDHRAGSISDGIEVDRTRTGNSLMVDAIVEDCGVRDLVDGESAEDDRVVMPEAHVAVLGA